MPSAKTIGIDLELESQEQDVGPFQADILCKDTATNNWVLIENQIEKTDHTPLGQILTYGAGLEATTIVWIAKRFTEEHRATLDWLNEITDERFNFFGLEIELWRIGNSPMAPKFNVVCKPNDWGKTVSDVAASGEISPEKQLRLDYWTVFVEFLRDHNSTLKTSKPQPWHYISIPIGRSGFGLSALAYLKDDRIGVGLYLQGRYAKNYFKLLQDERESIESEIGIQLEWNESSSTTRSINLFKNDVDLKNRQNWLDQHKWLWEKLEAFYSAFEKRIKSLDISVFNHSEDTVKSPNETTGF